MITIVIPVIVVISIPIMVIIVIPITILVIIVVTITIPIIIQVTVPIPVEAKTTIVVIPLVARVGVYVVGQPIPVTVGGRRLIVTVVPIYHPISVMVLWIDRALAILITAMVVIVPIADSVFVSVGKDQGVARPHVIQHHDAVQHAVSIQIEIGCFVLAHRQGNKAEIDIVILSQNEAGADFARAVSKSQGCNHLFGRSFVGDHHQTESDSSRQLQIKRMTCSTILFGINHVVGAIVAIGFNDGSWHRTLYGGQRCRWGVALGQGSITRITSHQPHGQRGNHYQCSYIHRLFSCISCF